MYWNFLMFSFVVHRNRERPITTLFIILWISILVEHGRLGNWLQNFRAKNNFFENNLLIMTQSIPIYSQGKCLIQTTRLKDLNFLTLKVAPLTNLFTTEIGSDSLLPKLGIQDIDRFKCSTPI